MEHDYKILPQGYHVVRQVNRCAFTGDTIFIGGCGKFFEGQPHEMVMAMRKVIDFFPPDTKLFCGHEYTVDNMHFCKAVLPESRAV